MRIARAVTLAALVWMAAGCRSSPERPNVLLVMWDTVRADRLGCYGYAKPTTPRLDAFADEARLYEDVISPSTWTIPTHAAMFTGRHQTESGTSWNRKWLEDDFQTLAEQLGAAGYQTYMFSANPLVSTDTNFQQGFETRDFPWEPAWREAVVRNLRERASGLPAVPSEESEKAYDFKEAGAVLNEAFGRWLDRRDAKKPFFAYVNYMEAHIPLYPVREERAMFLRPELIERSYRLRDTSLTRQAYSLRALEYGADDLEAIHGLYDASIRRLDELTGRLFADLERRGLLDDTVVIVTSDHGESLGEDHLLGHSFGIHQPLLGVPLVVRHPRLFPPARVKTPVQTHDLYPTILELAGIRANAPAGMWAHSLAREEADHPSPRYRVSEHLAPNLKGFRRVARSYPKVTDRSPSLLVDFRAVEQGKWKLVRSGEDAVALFDLENDPRETKDRYAGTSDRARSLEAALAEWRGSVVAFRATERPERKERDDEAIERMRSLGYVAGD